MGDPHSTFWQEIEIAFSKALGFLIWIAMGVAAKLALESRTKKLSWKEIISIVVISVFSGYLTAVILEKYGYDDWNKIIVPVSTLLGQSLMNYIMTNWERWAERLMPPFLKWLKNGKDEKKD